MADGPRRRDEAEALSAIFGDDFLEVSGSEWKFRSPLISREFPSGGNENRSAQLTCFLPEDYPSRSAPVLVVEGAGSGVHETCERFLAENFRPDEEIGFALAEQFFDLCRENHLEGTSAGGESAEVGNPGENEPEAVFKLVSPDVAAEISSSLGKDGSGLFQEYGPGIFVHGELGVAVEIREGPTGPELHVSVDGIDDEKIAAWVGKQLKSVGGNLLSTFGGNLLSWADSQRAAGEATYGAADGIVDSGSPPSRAGSLTGNAAWKARLRAGETVAFRGGGNSLHPRVKSGECCQYAPVFTHNDVKEKDIVFCQIKGRYWGHMVKKKTFVGGKDEFEYTISNIRGWENGTITLEHIYGKVVDHWK